MLLTKIGLIKMEFQKHEKKWLSAAVGSIS